MEQQLVATQESFARISEEAAGRLQDLSGKMVTPETLSRDSEALKQRLGQLDAQLQEQNAARENAQGQQGSLDKRVELIATQATRQQEELAQVQEQLKGLVTELTTLKQALPEQIKSAQGDQGKFEAQLKSLGADVASLKKQDNPAAAIERLEQELLVIRSEQDSRVAAAAPAASGGPSNAEYDAFRAQVTRNINALSSQVQSLSQRLNTRP